MMSRLAPVLLACALALAACGGNEQDGGDAGPTGSTSSTSSPTSSEPADSAYGVDAPAGVDLTEPGSTLSLGDMASIAWSPKKDLVGALSLKVTKIRQGSIKDFTGFTIDDRTKASTPYYVDVTAKNLGTTDLSGVAVPLYMLDDTDTLYGDNHFASTFAPCAAKPLPEKFTAEKVAKVCLVYLAPDHGTLTAISFRPSQDFNPITWTGEIVKPTPTKKPGSKKS